MVGLGWVSMRHQSGHSTVSTTVKALPLSSHARLVSACQQSKTTPYFTLTVI